MNYSQTSAPIRILRGNDTMIPDLRNIGTLLPAPRAKRLFVVRKADDRVCIIRTSDGVETEHRGADVPSVAAVLLFFKKRKLKALQERNRNGSALDRKQRMAQDLRNRFGDRGASANPSISPAALHWWERGGMLRS